MNVAKVVTLTGCKICFYKDLSSVLLCACVIVLVLEGCGVPHKNLNLKVTWKASVYFVGKLLASFAS